MYQIFYKNSKQPKEIFLQLSDYQYFLKIPKAYILQFFLHGMQEVVGSNPIFSTRNGL